MDATKSEWRNGFLFVGNQLFLDFLNTRPLMNGELVEMLVDWPALVRWLRAAGLLNARQAEKLAHRGSSSERTEVLGELLQLRETLRKVVVQVEEGKPVNSSTLAELNRLLTLYPSTDELRAVDSHIERTRQFDPQAPRDVLAPLVDHAAALLSDCDPARIRKCEQCVLHFHDTSKNGTRRWCSMQLCGNRAKVKAYADRKRNSG
ncbi:ABATE domain-containing protein [uncultured Paludibaculum sp.]|uniref:CGNR zinc finger domain-containing protein n=1 Tax=uncultured Paludibaculum sp. TaxID=1765020 RepID=UPI002AAB5E23|nr:ABATE domain-containing protein [uncultured Paludibaculum sp.]